MARKQLTETERATTPYSEEFFANAKLRNALASLAALIEKEMPDVPKNHVYSVIKQAVTLQIAKDYDEWSDQQEEALREGYAKLAALEAANGKG